jgi:hypothetical protein
MILQEVSSQSSGADVRQIANLPCIPQVIEKILQEGENGKIQRGGSPCPST